MTTGNLFLYPDPTMDGHTDIITHVPCLDVSGWRDRYRAGGVHPNAVDGSDVPYPDRCWLCGEPGAGDTAPTEGQLFDTSTIPHRLTLADRFDGVVPASVFTTYNADWKKRRADWEAIGLRRAGGREGVRTYGKSAGDDEVTKMMLAVSDGLSLFDPVLTEAVIRWYSAPDDIVLDPFAGGSVRGVITAALGRRYYGIDLSPVQVDDNYRNAEEVLDVGAVGFTHDPTWITGDAYHVLVDDPEHGDMYLPETVDLVFTCPPYYDLEVYSDNPADLSTMPDDEFDAAYAAIIGGAVDRLADNRFAVWVVGEVRDRQGMLRSLIPKTVAAFEAAGARYYDDAMLVSPMGTLRMRLAKQFSATRKMGRRHQSILVFVKGDPKVATDWVSGR